MTGSCGPAAASEAVAAQRDLVFLQAAGAVRRFEVEDGGYLVECADRRLLALPVAAIATFKAGVLLGWKLPREALR